MSFSDDKDVEYTPDPDEGEWPLESSSDEADKINNTLTQSRSRIRNKIWRHFEKVGTNKAKCTACETVMSAKIHGNMKRHWERLHGVIETDHERDVTEKEAKPAGAPQASRQRHSPIWQWFTEVSPFYCRCKLCHREMKHFGPGNLFRHLNRKHHKVWLQMKANQQRPKTPQVVKQSKSNAGEDTENVKSCACEDTTEGHKEECSYYEPPLFWSYFDKIELQSAHCLLCDSVVEWTEASDLRQHILEFHPSEPIQKVEAEVEAASEEVMVEHVAMDSLDFSEEDAAPEETRPANTVLPKISRLTESHYTKPRRSVVNSERTAHSEEWKQSLTSFGSYAASLMALLPRSVAARYQAQIIERLLKETAKYQHNE